MKTKNYTHYLIFVHECIFKCMCTDTRMAIQDVEWTLQDAFFLQRHVINDNLFPCWQTALFVYSYHAFTHHWRIMHSTAHFHVRFNSYAIGTIWNCQYSTALTFINSNTVAHANSTPLCEHEPWPCFGQWSMGEYDGCHLLSIQGKLSKEALTPCPLKGHSSARVLEYVIRTCYIQGIMSVSLNYRWKNRWEPICNLYRITTKTCNGCKISSLKAKILGFY